MRFSLAYLDFFVKCLFPFENTYARVYTSGLKLKDRNKNFLDWRRKKKLGMHFLYIFSFHHHNG